MGVGNKQFGRVPYFSIGDMRSVGTFYRNAPTTGTDGGQADAFVAVTTVRGRLSKRGGNKSLEQGEITTAKNFEWICRYNSDLLPDADWILNVNGSQYRIIDFELVDNIKHLYRFIISIN